MTASETPVTYWYEVEDRYPGGVSFYRAIARQLNGNPDTHLSILQCVQHHLLRSWVDSHAPNYSRYREYEQLQLGHESRTSSQGLVDPSVLPPEGINIVFQIKEIIVADTLQSHLSRGPRTFSELYNART